MLKKTALNLIVIISALFYPFFLCVFRLFRKDNSVRVLVYHKTSPLTSPAPTMWNVPPERFEKADR